MSEIIWIYLAVLVLAPVLRWFGGKVFRGPSATFATDPGPLLDSAATTLGGQYPLARMHTAVLLAAGMLLFPALAITLLATPLVLLAEAYRLVLPRFSEAQLVGGYLIAAPISVALSFRARARARRAIPLSLAVYRDRVRLPVASTLSLSARLVTLPLVSIRSVLLLADGGLLIDATRETYALSGTAFVDPASALRIRDAIVTQISQLPAGADVLARAEQDAAALRSFALRPAFGTWVVIGMCVVAFAIELLVGFENGALFRLGANVRSLTWHGDWYRLFTASFLHVGFWHILFNVSFISSVGGIVERAIGSVRFVVIYLFSGLAGAAMSSAFDFMSAGASTSAFGLLGALAFLESRRGDVLPRAVRLHASRWLVLIGINAALPLLFPNISWAGHVGGLVGGVLACAVVSGSTETLAQPEVPRGVRHALGFLIASHVLAFGIAADRARDLDDYQGAFIEALARDPGIAVLEELNNLAWSIAIDPKAPPARLKTAVALAQRAATGDHVEFQDTLAQALHRTGDADAAVRVEAQALLEAGTAPYATQLARFLRARLDRDKAPLIDPAAGEVGSLQPSLGPSSLQVAIDVPAPLAKTLIVYSLGRPLGLLELCLAAGPAGRRTLRVEGDALPAGATFELGYVAPSRCPPGRTRFFSATDPAVRALP